MMCNQSYGQKPVLVLVAESRMTKGFDHGLSANLSHVTTDPVEGQCHTALVKITKISTSFLGDNPTHIFRPCIKKQTNKY